MGLNVQFNREVCGQRNWCIAFTDTGSESCSGGFGVEEVLDFIFDHRVRFSPSKSPGECCIAAEVSSATTDELVSSATADDLVFSATTDDFCTKGRCLLEIKMAN